MRMTSDGRCGRIRRLWRSSCSRTTTDRACPRATSRARARWYSHGWMGRFCPRSLTIESRNSCAARRAWRRRCLWDRTLPAHADDWVACFRDAYLAAMPQVCPRNVSFYQGLTLVRKIYTVYRKQTPDWVQLAPQLAARARAALEDAVPSGQPR